MIKSRLGAHAVVMQLPIGAETEFKGVVDLIEMKALVWRDETLGAAWDVVEIPADLQAQAEEYREKMIEAAVEMDETALENYLEGKMPSNDEIRALIRKGTIAVKFYPDVLRLGLQEQGRAAAARRRRRLSAVAGRRSGHQGRRRRRPTPRSSVMPTTTSRCRCWPSRS